MRPVKKRLFILQDLLLEQYDAPQSNTVDLGISDMIKANRTPRQRLNRSIRALYLP